MKGGLDQTYLDNLTTGYARGQIIWVIYMVILTSMGLGGIPGPQFFFVNFLSPYMNTLIERGCIAFDYRYSADNVRRTLDNGNLREQT